LSRKIFNFFEPRKNRFALAKWERFFEEPDLQITQYVEQVKKKVVAIESWSLSDPGSGQIGDVSSGILRGLHPETPSPLITPPWPSLSRGRGIFWVSGRKLRDFNLFRGKTGSSRSEVTGDVLVPSQ
jgi:hypothetical protein